MSALVVLSNRILKYELPDDVMLNNELANIDMTSFSITNVGSCTVKPIILVILEVMNITICPTLRAHAAAACGVNAYWLVSIFFIFKP